MRRLQGEFAFFSYFVFLIKVKRGPRCEYEKIDSGEKQFGTISPREFRLTVLSLPGFKSDYLYALCFQIYLCVIRRYLVHSFHSLC